MDAVLLTLRQLEDLCTAIQDFYDHELPLVLYRAPVIDYFHPEDYRQKAITGLRKFKDTAEAERDYVAALATSQVPPKDLTTNAPNLLAVWEEFKRAKPPLVAIAHFLDGTDRQTKIDVISDGGSHWTKVNTIKLPRLLAEFREHDSYQNSDYESDSSSHGASSSSGPARIASSAKLSLVQQAEALVRAAKRCPRPLGLEAPKVSLVLNRLEGESSDGHQDPRIPDTFEQLRRLGVDLVLGTRALVDPRPLVQTQFHPTKDILLDLSVIIALCCDSTHHPLPLNTDELEKRFRPKYRADDCTVGLAAHSNVSRDLRDQLEWETQHPLIEELQARFRAAGYIQHDLKFWVTQEVKDRTGGIVDIIGGPGEKARAAALSGEVEGGFWTGSRYEHQAGVLSALRAGVLPPLGEEVGALTPGLDTFSHSLILLCEQMLQSHERGYAEPSKAKGSKINGKRSRNPKRPDTLFPSPSRLPSPHTLRTLITGASRGMTVLTNNRGAVGKIIREMGVMDGWPTDDQHAQSPYAKVWVVNPSSLSEWRRLQVEKANASFS